MKEIMLFQAGEEQFGLDLSWVKGVYRAADLAECTEGTELSAETVRTCRLPDGAEMPLYDFPKIFGMLSPGIGAFSPWRKVIRMEVEGSALSILADHIDRVVETEAELLVPLPPVFGEKSRKWFPVIFRTDKRLIPLLDPAGMAGIAPASAESGPEGILSRFICQDAVEKQILSAIHRETARVMRKELIGMTEKMIKAVQD